MALYTEIVPKNKGSVTEDVARHFGLRPQYTYLSASIDGVIPEARFVTVQLPKGKTGLKVAFESELKKKKANP